MHWLRQASIIKKSISSIKFCLLANSINAFWNFQVFSLKKNVLQMETEDFGQKIPAFPTKIPFTSHNFHENFNKA